MADDLIARLGELLKKRPWYELPRLMADSRLVELPLRADPRLATFLFSGEAPTRVLGARV